MEVPKFDNQTLMKGQKTMLTFKIDNMPREFMTAIAQDIILNQKYNLLEEKASDETLLSRIREDRAERICLICPWSKKRILNPIWNKNCKHSEIVLFDLYSLLIAFQDRAAKIECPICDAFFHIENIFELAVVDARLKECVKKESLCYTNLYFVRREHQPKYEG